MEDAAVDKNDFSGPGRKFFFVQGDVESTLEDTDDFILYMPMVGHYILGMGIVYVVKFKGEIIGSPLLILIEM